MRKDREIFNAVNKANADHHEFFEGLGLNRTRNSYVQQIWQGQVRGRTVEVSISNMGKWELSQCLMKVQLPTPFAALAAIGETVPPLLRTGTQTFDCGQPGLKAYAHHVPWATAMLNTHPGTALTKRFADYHYLHFEPGRLSWSGDVLKKDDAWITEQLGLLADLVTACEAVPPGPAIPEGLLRSRKRALVLILAVSLIALMFLVTIALKLLL